MFRKITFNFNFVEDCIENCQWLEISYYLKDQFKIKILENGQPNRIEFSQKVIDKLNDLLKILLKHEVWNADLTQLLVETIKSLRNCAVTEKTQNYLANNDFFTTLYKIFKRLDTESSSNSLGFKLVLQLLLNMFTLNVEVARKVDSFFYDIVYKHFLKDVHIFETSALIYNFYKCKEEQITDEKLINKIIDLYNSDHSNEFLLFLIDQIITNDYFWTNYDNFKVENRLILLGVLKERVLQKKCILPICGADSLVKSFLKSSNVIFQVTENKNYNAAYEVSCILEIISTMSAEEQYLLHFQKNKEIIINAGVLLININRLGKLTDNCFTPTQKLSEVQNPNPDIQQHPAFGFKADLVRLIGNLCWKNKKMQDLARSAEVIPVLLNCCNIDAKNPFIIQWGILAIRNLCENNVENQKLIAGLHQEGTVTSEMLEDMGITLHSDGENSLKIVSLDSLRISNT